MNHIRLQDALLLAQSLCPQCRAKMIIGLSNLVALKDPQPQAVSPISQILADVAKDTGWSVDAIRNGDHTAPLVAARKEFARRARAKGYSLPLIGRLIHRHHTTIVHYLKGTCAHG